MEKAISSILDNKNLIGLKKAMPLTHTEELKKIYKIKCNLSLSYFIGVVILLSSLLI